MGKYPLVGKKTFATHCLEKENVRARRYYRGSCREEIKARRDVHMFTQQISVKHPIFLSFPYISSNFKF